MTRLARDTARWGPLLMVLPEGQVYRQEHMPRERLVRIDVQHPQLKALGFSHKVTHVEFVQTGLQAADPAHGDYAARLFPVYVVRRGLRQVGPPIDDAWEEVPLYPACPDCGWRVSNPACERCRDSPDAVAVR